MKNHPDILQLAAEVRTTFDHHPWAEAMLLRAQARVSGRADDWQRAADAFAAVGAHFEWASTVTLADGSITGDGPAVLTSLECRPPAA